MNVRFSSHLCEKHRCLTAEQRARDSMLAHCQEPPERIPPAVLVVMGVSGSGKTTIAARLASVLGWEAADGDDFHSPESIRKMSSGIPLTDDDRSPWLRAIASWIDSRRVAGRRAVVACSALKRSYRDVLRGGRPDVQLVYLKGDAATIERRLGQRQGHFMPAALLGTQFEALEEPQCDERPIVVSIDSAPHVIVTQILNALHAGVHNQKPA